MVWADRLRPREPERGKTGEDATLVRDHRRMHDVERRDAVGRQQQEALGVECVQVSDLPASQAHGFSHDTLPHVRCTAQLNRILTVPGTARKTKRRRVDVSPGGATVVYRTWS